MHGSFLKNPIVKRGLLSRFSTAFSDDIGLRKADATVPLAAGWLIEQAGLGFVLGNALDA